MPITNNTYCNDDILYINTLNIKRLSFTETMNYSFYTITFILTVFFIDDNSSLVSIISYQQSEICFQFRFLVFIALSEILSFHELSTFCLYCFPFTNYSCNNAIVILCSFLGNSKKCLS